MSGQPLAGVVYVTLRDNPAAEQVRYFPSVAAAEIFISMIPDRQRWGDPEALKIASARLGKGILSAS